jgi:hypothetical protein
MMAGSEGDTRIMSAISLDSRPWICDVPQGTTARGEYSAYFQQLDGLSALYESQSIDQMKQTGNNLPSDSPFTPPDVAIFEDTNEAGLRVRQARFIH